jgi:hypothetical protein
VSCRKGPGAHAWRATSRKLGEKGQTTHRNTWRGGQHARAERTT